MLATNKEPQMSLIQKSHINEHKEQTDRKNSSPFKCLYIYYNGIKREHTQYRSFKIKMATNFQKSMQEAHRHGNSRTGRRFILDTLSN